MPCKRKYTPHTAFIELGKIDKAHESGTITKAQHDSRSKAVIKNVAITKEMSRLLKIKVVRSGRRK